MIARDLADIVLDAALLYPVVTVTGPRQSGKTTLCRALFPDRPYVSLEPLDVREHAVSDPRGFLAEIEDGAVLDEVQHAPGLFSYLQEEVDRRPDPGRFVLTGSQHFGLSQQISQSLAGRTAVLHLLPPGLDELRRFPSPPEELFATLLTGAFPRIHDRAIPSDRWLADYVATYVQRDVRQLLEVGNLQTFATFLRLCAGRTAQELNLSSLAGDVGVTHNTIRSWLSVLETSYLVFRLPAWHRNPGKRLVKAPKLHWIDSGLVCHLLGIRETEQLKLHPLRGSIFESWVASEIRKAHLHRGVPADLYHLRQTRGTELDLIVEHGRALVSVECKSGRTVSGEFLRPLNWFREAMLESGEADRVDSVLVHGGDASQTRDGVAVLPWAGVADHPWTGEGREPRSRPD